MESIFNTGTLTVKPEGRVDTSNAAEVEKELFALVDEHKPDKIIIDAEKLEYISSVGLRVVLKLKKTVEDTSIINASLEVYDIFDMTAEGTVLVEPVKMIADCYGMAGSLVGLLGGWILERRFIKFEPAKKIWQKIVSFIIGGILLVVVVIGIGKPVMAALEECGQAGIYGAKLFAKKEKAA